MSQKRLDYIDMVKGVGIILVVLGHSGYIPEGMLTWLASFHMPLFFLVSGILFHHKNSERENFGAYLKKRACGIMIPYALFSLIYLGVDYYYLMAHPEIMDLPFLYNAVFQAISLYGISVLWFLPAIFFGELCLYGLIRLWKKKSLPFWTLGLLCPAIAWIPPVVLKGMEAYVIAENLAQAWLVDFIIGMTRVVPALIFLLIGYLLYFGLQRFHWRKEAEIFLGIGFLLLNGAIAFANGRVDLHFMVFNNVGLFFAGACSAALGLLLIFRNLPVLWLLEFLGANSLIVMLTHLDCQVMSNAIHFASVMNRFIPRAKDVMFRVNLFGFLLIAELILIVLINRIGFFLIGRSRPVKMRFPAWWEKKVRKKWRERKFRRVK